MALSSVQVSARPNLRATKILDWEYPGIRKLADELRPQAQSPRDYVQAVHQHLTSRLRPIYDLDEFQPASVTLERGAGSCSQRMACLEAISRAGGVCTRVRALHVNGAFWYPRFPLLRVFIPERILLVWPQFLLDESWVDFDELYAPIMQLAKNSPGSFRNDGESLFEAVQHAPVDFSGKSCGLSCAKPEYDLSKFVLSDEGVFDTRDEVFDRFGSFQHTMRGKIFRLLFSGRASVRLPIRQISTIPAK